MPLIMEKFKSSFSKPDNLKQRISDFLRKAWRIDHHSEFNEFVEKFPFHELAAHGSISTRNAQTRSHTHGIGITSTWDELLVRVWWDLRRRISCKSGSFLSGRNSLTLLKFKCWLVYHSWNQEHRCVTKAVIRVSASSCDINCLLFCNQNTRVSLKALELIKQYSGELSLLLKHKSALYIHKVLMS
jgi:hypothetical protein